MKFCFAILSQHESHRSYPSRRRACFLESPIIIIGTQTNMCHNTHTHTISGYTSPIIVSYIDNLTMFLLLCYPFALLPILLIMNDILITVPGTDHIPLSNSSSFTQSSQVINSISDFIGNLHPWHRQRTYRLVQFCKENKNSTTFSNILVYLFNLSTQPTLSCGIGPFA